MTRDALPPEAIRAAEKILLGILDPWLPVEVYGTALETQIRPAAARALEAAAPHLAAAEREACARLADQVKAHYMARGDNTPDGRPSGLEPFAALLRKDPR